jgi:small basic protein (TIGR04137 family)
MSIHRSLRGVDTLKGERSVLTRFERVHKLIADGKLDAESGSAYGLPKVRTKYKIVSGKKAKALADQRLETAKAKESSKG